MALSANTVFEVRVGGNDTNGGGWVTGSSASGGVDFSQQTAAQYSVTDGVTNGSTVITSATAAFGTDVVGNILYVQGGTGAVSSGWYQVISRTNATTITVDRLTGLTSGTGTTLKIGGAFASPATAAGVATVSGMTTFIKYSSTPFTVSSTTNNISGGCVSGTDGTVYAGYDTTRSVYNLDANRATVKLSSALGAATIFTNVNGKYSLQSVILDANNVTGSRCAQMSGEYFYVKGMNGVSGGLNQNSQTGRAILCETTGCSASPNNIYNCQWCVSHDNTLSSPTNSGAFQQSPAIWLNCISYNNNCDGFTGGSDMGGAFNCVAYGNGGHGFDALNCQLLMTVNCISEANTGAGFRTNVGQISMIDCASFNNSSGRFVNSGGGKQWVDLNPIIGSGTFFTSSQDFTLNNTAGGGALCRAAGFPSSFPVPPMNDYLDVGALQHQDTGGGGTTIISGVLGS